MDLKPTELKPAELKTTKPSPRQYKPQKNIESADPKPTELLKLLRPKITQPNPTEPKPPEPEIHSEGWRKQAKIITFTLHIQLIDQIR